MCLIIICPQGTGKGSEFLKSALDNGASKHSDGIGISFKRANTNIIYVSKGYTQAERAWNYIQNLKLKPIDELIIHCRTGTSGTHPSQNCHPFVITDNKEDTLLEEGATKNPVLFHNGVFKDYNETGSDYSDTYHFTRRFMGIPQMSDLMQKDFNSFLMVAKAPLEGQKVAFLLPNQNLQHTPNFLTVQGYLFSNIGYASTFRTSDPTFDERVKALKAKQTSLTGTNVRLGALSNVKIDKNNYSDFIFKSTVGAPGFELNKHYFIKLFSSDGNHLISPIVPPTLNEGTIRYMSLNRLRKESLIFATATKLELYSDYNRIMNILSDKPSKSVIKKLSKFVRKALNKNKTTFKFTKISSQGLLIASAQLYHKQIKGEEIKGNQFTETLNGEKKSKKNSNNGQMLLPVKS